MAVPDYQSVMLPLLELASDGEEHSLGDAIEVLADRFGLSAADRDGLLPSGTQRTWNNRVAWASSYLRHARLLSSARRGRFEITERGRAVLAAPPKRIDRHFLSQYPEFVQFITGSPGPTDESGGGEGSGSLQGGELGAAKTPEEQLEAIYQGLRQHLAQELLERVRTVSPSFFEQLVVDLLVAMGYGGSRKEAGRAVGRSGDGGIDGIINEDRLGLDVVYVQAKRWEGTVGRPQIQMFTGSLEGHRASKGVFITTSDFSSDALGYIRSIGKKIVLIDGRQLAELMIDHGVGVASVTSYALWRVDADYFESA
jgi:restriction system protein